MKKKEMIQTIFDEMVNLVGGRLPESADLDGRRLAYRELDGLYMPKEADSEIEDQCCRYKWSSARTL